MFHCIIFKSTRKIPKNKHRSLYFSKALFQGLIFGGAYIRSGFSTEGNLRFKIDWASLLSEGNLPFLLCFTLLEGNFQVQAPRGAYIWRGDLTGVFKFALRIGGLIFGGAYFRNFTVLKR